MKLGADIRNLLYMKSSEFNAVLRLFHTINCVSMPKLLLFAAAMRSLARASSFCPLEHVSRFPTSRNKVRCKVWRQNFVF